MGNKILLTDRRLLVIFSVTLISVMGVASLTPAFPKISEALQLSKVQVGILISAFTFSGIILTPFAGIVADRRGRKAVLIPSLFVFALAGSCIFFVHDFTLIIVLRIIQGIGAAPLASINTTLIGDYFKGKELAGAMGLNASVLSLSTGFYPLIGGALASIAWYYPFLLPLLAIPVGLLVIFGIPEPKIVKATNLKQYLKAISANIAKKEVIGIFLLGILTFIILYGAFITYMPFLLHQRFKFSAMEIGVIMSLGSFSSALCASQLGKLTQRFGSLLLLKLAFVMYLVVNIFLPHTHSVAIFVLLVLMFGAAQAFNLPSLQTLLAKIAPDNQRGAFMSLNGMILRLGQTLGPVIIGLGYTHFQLNGAYYFAAIMAVLGLVVLFTLLGSREKSNKTHTDF